MAKVMFRELLAAFLSTPAAREFGRELGKNVGQGFSSFTQRFGVDSEKARSEAHEAYQRWQEQRTPYKTLGLDPDAEWEVVDAAYKRLAKKYHPDSGKKPDSERMKEVNQAFDEIKKKKRGGKHG